METSISSAGPFFSLHTHTLGSLFPKRRPRLAKRAAKKIFIKKKKQQTQESDPHGEDKISETKTQRLTEKKEKNFQVGVNNKKNTKKPPLAQKSTHYWVLPSFFFKLRKIK